MSKLTKKKAQQAKKEEKQKVKRNKMIERIIFFSALIIIIASFIYIFGSRYNSSSNRAYHFAPRVQYTFDHNAPRISPEEIPQLVTLKEYIFAETGMGKIKVNLQKNSKNYKRNDFIVFLSVSGVQNRADVVKGIGATLEKAWEQAEKRAAEIVSGKKYNVVWAKADIVNTAKEIPMWSLRWDAAWTIYPYFYRKGVSFDNNFNNAFLEAEINGNNLLTYNSVLNLPTFQLTNINAYLSDHYGKSGLKNIPGRITAFTTIGFLCNEDCNVYDLYTNGLDYGRRVIDIADDKSIEPIIISAANYLYSQLLPDGSFIYGHYPLFDQSIRSYNIIRHAGSIWSLINLYRMTNDQELIPKIDAAISYVLDGNIEYKTADTAYVIDRVAREVKLGANGVAIVMLTEYMDVFKTDKYSSLVGHLANGILELQDNHGGYFHVLNYPGWSRKAKYRIVYYDGEATFALARAFTYTNEQKYLDAAVLAVENFIAKKYEKYTDHWIAYSLNEVTKYVQEPRYYEFSMRNVWANLNKIYKQETAWHTYLELLMAGWLTYERQLEKGITIKYPKGFTPERFAETIYKRANHMLNAYFYPEYAMYMKAPYKIADSFFVRHDRYRVRIDDIQHFIGGYYNYYFYYKNIRAFLSDEFITEINKINIVNN